MKQARAARLLTDAVERTRAEPYHRALSSVSSRERDAMDREVARRTADDLAWERLNDRITAGLDRSSAADARALSHAIEMENR